MIADSVPIAVDWSNATLGDPLADVANTLLILEYADLSTAVAWPVQRRIQEVRSQFALEYWMTYARNRFADRDQLKPWMLVMTAARLAKPMSDSTRRVLVSRVRELLS